MEKFDTVITAIRIYILTANCIAETTLFLVFSLLPLVWNAVRLTSQVSSNDFIRLLNTQYNQRDFPNAWSNLKVFLLSWIDSILLHCLLISSRQVDKWYGTQNRACHKTNRTEDEVSIQRSIRERFIRTVLFLKRTTTRAVQTRIIQLRVHHSNLQYALMWMLYNMVWRPPLVFLYLLNTVVNEWSFYFDLPVESRESKRRRRMMLNQMRTKQQLIDQNRKRMELGDLVRTLSPEPPVSPTERMLMDLAKCTENLLSEQFGCNIAPKPCLDELTMQKLIKEIQDTFIFGSLQLGNWKTSVSDVNENF